MCGPNARAGSLSAVTAVTIKDALNMAFAAAIPGHGVAFFLSSFLVPAIRDVSDHFLSPS